jgi:hypothetical protein
MSLTTALIFLYLWIPAALIAELGGGSGPDAEIGWYVPFMVTCCLAFFGIVGFLAEPGRNPALSPDEKRKWRLAIFFGWPIAAPLYWSRFK